VSRPRVAVYGASVKNRARAVSWASPIVFLITSAREPYWNAPSRKIM
jgi:hypothetical protein